MRGYTQSIFGELTAHLKNWRIPLKHGTWISRTNLWICNLQSKKHLHKTKPLIWQNNSHYFNMQKLRHYSNNWGVPHISLKVCVLIEVIMVSYQFYCLEVLHTDTPLHPTIYQKMHSRRDDINNFFVNFAKLNFITIFWESTVWLW